MDAPALRVPVRVAVIDDDPALLEVIRATIEAHSDYLLAGVYTTPRAALQAFSTDPPDLLVVDYKLPGMSGLECVRAVRERSPATRILLMTGYLHALGPEHGPDLRATHGCLPKPFHPADLLHALGLVASGLFVWPPELQRRLLGGTRTKTNIPWHPDLSRRENELMALLSENPALLDQGLADHLHITKESIRSHLTRIFHKFNVHTRSDAIATFRRERK